MNLSVTPQAPPPRGECGQWVMVLTVWALAAVCWVIVWRMFRR